MAKRQLVGKPTKEKTRAGRTVYITDKDIKDEEGNTFIKKGSRVSEISSTVGPIKGKYYNIPSIHAGKNYTDNELTEAIKNNRLIPTSVHDSIPEAEAAAKKRSNELNKGGAMLSKQMEMFEEGGLRDEGGTVDPVSGNDVPSGSNKSEVRDDIPAMLSEGEFVIPADVVRYIGLSKLMQMRQEAKMGLQMMEKMGQMGNSEEAEIPDDLPFGVTDIIVMEDEDEDNEKEMAQGGVIEAAEGSLVEKGIDAMFSPAGMTAGLSPAAAILANATGADKRIYKALFDDTATFTGRDRGPVITGTASENKGKFYKNLASKSAKALLKLGVPLSVMMPDEMGDGTIPEELLDKLEFTENKRAQGGVIKAQEGIDVSKGVGAIRYDDGTIDNSAMMDAFNRGQPQQTDFEQMMGYGAGQGSNPYGARRVPYTKADGSTINILEDYMGRPMESIEGLTRSVPYQAGPIMGGDTPAGGGSNIQPVLPPMPVDPTDNTAARREQERKDKRKEARGDTFDKIARDRNEYNRLRNNKNSLVTREDVLEEARKGQTGNILKDLKIAGADLKTRPSLMKKELIDQLKAIPDELKKAPDVLKAIRDVYKGAGKEVVNKITGKDDDDAEKKAREKRKDKKRREDAIKTVRKKEKTNPTKERKEKGEGIGGDRGMKKGGLMKKDYP